MNLNASIEFHLIINTWIFNVNIKHEVHLFWTLQLYISENIFHYNTPIYKSVHNSASKQSNYCIKICILSFCNKMHNTKFGCLLQFCLFLTLKKPWILLSRIILVLKWPQKFIVISSVLYWNNSFLAFNFLYCLYH